MTADSRPLAMLVGGDNAQAALRENARGVLPGRGAAHEEGARDAGALRQRQVLRGDRGARRQQPRDLRNRLNRIQDKIGAQSKQELIIWAVRQGLLDDVDAA